MGINKVQYGNTTLIDLTSDTVTADKLMQGYTAHDRSGALITGTATGGSGDGYVWQDENGYVHLSDEQGTSVTVEALSVTQNGTYTAPTGKAYSPVSVSVSSGGLEIESGIIEATSKTQTLFINFENSHSTLPFFWAIFPAEAGYDETLENGLVVYYFNYESAFGNPLYRTESSYTYGEVRYTYRSTNATGTSAGSNSLIYPVSNTTSSSASYPRYWVTETQIKARTGTSSAYWQKNKSYKWIAVWSPFA